MNYNIGFYVDNLTNFEDIASYKETKPKESLFVIGDLLYENSLLEKRIVHAKQNLETVTAFCKSKN